VGTGSSVTRADRISVILPCLNEAPILPARLARLQALRAAGHELILVDGGSRDGSAGIARPLVDRVLDSPPGRARQMNLGARAATGDVLWFLHVDCQPPAGAADALLEAVRGGSDWGRFEVRLSGRSPLLRMVERMMGLRSRLTGIATGDQGVFVRRALFESAGGFADMPLMEDIELSARLKRVAWPALLPRRILASSRRWERNGILRTIAQMWVLRTAYWLGVDPSRLARAYYPKSIERL
jgi:rSAM/selenodomain-associated transferase 2